MSYSWFRQGTCTVSRNSATVRFTNANITQAKNKPVVGDAFTVDNADLYEVIFIGVDSTGEYATLERPFSEPTVTDVPYAMMRLASSTQNAKLVAMASAAINQKQISLDDMYEWYTATTDTVDFHGPDGNAIQVASFHSLSLSVATVGNNISAVEAVANNIDAVKAAPAAAVTATTKAAEASASALEGKGYKDSAALSAAAAAASSASLARTEADMNAEREEVGRITEASGVVNSGKHRISGDVNIAVNEGMWVDSSKPNSIFLGSDANGAVGKSKENAPRFNIARMVTELITLPNSEHSFEVKLPTAPVDGTCTFDSAKGEYLDFTKEIDPKYGNVAADKAEAVARAFEGGLIPRNLRLGGAGFSITSSVAIEAGKATWDGSGFKSLHGKANMVIGAKYKVMLTINGVSSGSAFLYHGNSSEFTAIPILLSDVNKEIEVTFVAAGTDPFSLASGISFNITALEAHKETTEPVTSPVDMWGFEASLQAVTQANPFICDHGLPQSQSPSIDGVNTTRSNRPASYSAWFEGDDSSAELGCDFHAASVLQRDIWLSNHSLKLYKMKDGTIAQWCVNGRSFRSLGNGDWESIDAANSISGYLSAGGVNSYIKPRGGNDNPVGGSTFGSPTGGLYSTRAGAWGSKFASKDLALFTAVDSFEDEGGIPSIAVNGECYFLVCGTVPRLSQSMYVEGLNENGTMKAADDKKWYETTETFLTVEDCFNPAKLLAGSGSVASGKSGRPDGRYFDRVYPGGVGGVIDERKSTFGKSKSDMDEVNQSVEDGIYRGKEKRKFTKVFASVVDVPADFEIVNKDNLSAVVAVKETNISVSGEFMQKEVIGNPVAILANPLLKNGFGGVWNKNIPDGTQKDTVFSRKSIGNFREAVHTSDNGLNWNTLTINNFSEANNSWNNTTLANDVIIINYTAFAAQTKKSTAKEIKAGSVGKVLVTDSNKREEGVFLHESLMGAVGTGANFLSYSVLTQAIKSVLVSASHVEIKLTGTTSPCVKVLPMYVDDNGQAQIQYLANEMKWNSDFGDSSDMSIGSGTYTNDNGDVCRRDNHKLSISPGWFENNA